eukprot:g8959.t1
MMRLFVCNSNIWCVVAVLFFFHTLGKHNVNAAPKEPVAPPSERIIINSENDRIAELYTYTKWEHNNPSVIVAAAQSLADYHAIAVPHLADDKEYVLNSKYLNSAINILIAQIDKLKLNEDKSTKEIIFKFKDVIAELTSELGKWPTVMVWSSAERIGGEGPAAIPENKRLVHRGFDIANFFLSEVIGETLNWTTMPGKLDILMFFEMYCKQLESILQKNGNPNAKKCEDMQYLETLRVEKNLFMLQAQAAKAVEYLEKALKATAASNKENREFFIAQAITLMKRIKKKQTGTLKNLAHKQRAEELFSLTTQEAKAEL